MAADNPRRGLAGAERVFQDDGLPGVARLTCFHLEPCVRTGRRHVRQCRVAANLRAVPNPGRLHAPIHGERRGILRPDDVAVNVTPPPNPPESKSPMAPRRPWSFTTEPGRSYSVPTRTSLQTGDWTRVSDIAAGGGGSLVEVPVVDGDAERYYQVVTPALP